MDARRAERAFVLLVALHSAVIGLFLLFLTEWGARVGGYGTVQPLFFARQAGAFHLVVAAGYAIEHLRYGGILLLLTAKACAVVFLLGSMLADPQPWVVPVSAAGDAALGLVALTLHRRAVA